MTGLDKDHVHIILKQYNSHFTTYEISPCFYTYEDFSEVLPRGFKKEFEIRGRLQQNHKYDQSNSIIFDCNNNSMITELIVRYHINAMRVDKESYYPIGVTEIIMNILMKKFQI